MIQVAVIGSGYWGKNLIRNFNELGVLHTICDRDISTLKSLQGKYPDKKLESSYKAVLQNSAINTVVIATPAEGHFELAREALLAGKHVFVEKPLSLVVNEAETLHKLAISHNLTLMVGHILLYHPAIIKLKELISSGKLGKINYIYSNRLNLGKFRTEENILWSFAPHDISAILYLLEEMPIQVMAYGGNYLHHDIADVTISILSFKSGVKGHIFVSWLHPNKDQRLVVVGDKKMAVFDDTLPEGKLQLHDKGVEWVNRHPVPRKKEAQTISIESYEPLKAECAHFLQCVETGETPKTDGNNGIQVLQILDACQKSLEHQGAILNMNGNNKALFTYEFKPNISVPDHSNITNPVRGDIVGDTFYAHETVVIDFPCRIGKETKIWHFSHVMRDCRIGERCNIGQNVVISPGVIIGNNVKIQNNVSVYEGVTIEDDVFCGPSMVFTNVINPRSHISRRHAFKPTLVKKGATIGANATIICGHTIGRYAFVGAGAVVTKDVPDYALVLGNAAKISGWMCECGHQLSFQGGIGICAECGKQYAKADFGLKPVKDQGRIKESKVATGH